jgi:nucleotide-binding universal stress UspA family protein
MRPLLATEHSEYDTGAEALAFALAHQGGLPLRGVLPMVSNPEFEMVAPQLAAKADAEASAKRQSLVALARAAGVQFDLRVRRGPEAYAEIVDEARACAADLIVIRRRGKRGLLANLLVGEMVSKVVAHAPCSVLIAPRGALLWTRQVLVGVDPQAPDTALLAQAAALAGAYGLPLRLLCVAASEAVRAPAQQALSAALLRARERGGDVDGEVRVGRPHQELIAAAKACRADLLVVARHGGDTHARAWIGGVAQKVIGLADCPVLVHVGNSTSNPKSATP